MTVYVLVSSPYHDNGSVIGVYATLELAKAAHPGDWEDEGFYVDPKGWDACSQLIGGKNEDDHLIHRMEVQT